MFCVSGGRGYTLLMVLSPPCRHPTNRFYQGGAGYLRNATQRHSPFGVIFSSRIQFNMWRPDIIYIWEKHTPLFFG